MMINEFIKLTGFEPTAEEYAAIEKQYMDEDIDKNEFCKKFVSNGEAKRIYRERSEQICTLKKVIADKEKQIAELEQKLDIEYEWKKEACGTNMAQNDYIKLDESYDVTRLSIPAAKALICDEFGFGVDNIEIVTSVTVYDKNRHGMLRKAAVYERKPLYFATDYNYICFKCNGYDYEMVNGGLHFC